MPRNTCARAGLAVANSSETMRPLSMIVVLVLGACADPPSVCEQAAERLDSCLPGLAAEHPATCDADAESHAAWVLERSCDEILLDAGDGKADGIPSLQGVKIRKEGNLTYFSI